MPPIQTLQSFQPMQRPELISNEVELQRIQENLELPFLSIENTGKKSQLKKRAKASNKQRTPNKKLEIYNLDIILNVYSLLIKEHIDIITISQCAGCMLNAENGHDICQDRYVCVENFFEAAFELVDETVVKRKMETENIIKYPSKNELKKNEKWCKSIKNMLTLM